MATCASCSSTPCREPDGFPQAAGTAAAPARCVCEPPEETEHADQDRIDGAARIIGDDIKERVGKILGDAKLENEGKADQAAGKIQNAIGGIKDALRGDTDKRDQRGPFDWPFDRTVWGVGETRRPNPICRAPSWPCPGLRW